MPEGLVVIGEIARAHGLAGELRVTPLTDDPARFEGLTECVLWDAPCDRRETRRVTAARRHGAAVLVTLAGCGSADEARALVGRLVALPRVAARPAGPGRLYAWQLEGCRVLTEEGRDIGVVSEIQPSPAQDLWVVRNGDREHLIPAVDEIVRDVDLAGRRVVIRPPDGLLEL